MVGKKRKTASWTPRLSTDGGPVYMAIADAIAADLASGTLTPGTRLPAQRALADALAIDFSTVSRAYAEARRRGLVDAFVGQGTFVRRKAQTITAPLTSGLVDMSMNMPPKFDDPELTSRMWEGISSLEASGGLDLLLRYQEPGGAAVDRAAAAHWLSDRIPSAKAERLLICPGTQGALLCLAGILSAPGDAMCTELLTYPGFRSLAAHLRIPLVSVATDEEGILPDSLDAACRKHKPKALYCTPTLQNPMATIMSLGRRQEIVAVAREHRLSIIEDDVYGPLVPEAQPLAAIAPELVFYIGGLAKSLSPALRIAYLIVPDARMALRMAGSLRATSGMTSPLCAALATRWIEDGTAHSVRRAIQKKSDARRAIAAASLPAEAARIPEHGFHLWLKLPAQWSRGEFSARLRSAGIGVVPSDAFALSAPPEGVRLGLGGTATRDDLAQGTPDRR